MVLLDIGQRDGAQGGRRDLAQHRVASWQQRKVKGARSAVARALQVAGNELSSLVLDHGKSFCRERWVEFVVRQQFHSAGKILLQYLHGEIEARGLIGSDVVERLLKGQAVERLGAIGVESVEQIGDSFLAFGGLQIGVVLNLTHYGYGRTGVVGLDDQADAVGERSVRGDDVVGWDLELRERARSPGGQHYRLGWSRRHLLFPAKAFSRDCFSRRRGLQGGGDGICAYQVLLRHPVYVGQGDAPDGVDVLIRRRTAFGSKRLRPQRSQTRG